jgi:hypothetical protein
MAYVVDSSNILIASRRTLLTLNKRFGFSWRRIADAYGVNVKYVHEMAKQGKKPTNPDVLEKMGLKRKPKPLTAFHVARFRMAEETKAILKGWKL